MTLTDPDTDVSRRSVDERPILLPAAGDGQRRRRRYERQRVLRQRWMAAGAVLVAAAAAVLLLRGTHAGTKQPAVQPQPIAPSPAVDTGASAPPSVLVQQVNNGRTTSLTAFLPSSDGAGGTVLVFPSNTTLATVAANLPRHKADTILTVEDTDLSRLLAAAGPLAVNVNGAPSTVAPDQIPSFLTAAGPGDKLSRQRAFWDAWLTRVRDNPGAAPTQAGLAKAVATMVKGAWTVAVPPGTAGG